MTKLHLLSAVCACLFSVTSVNASVVFYRDKSLFDAATTTTTVDFEGIVGDSGFSMARSHVIDDVTFTTSLLTNSWTINNATICGRSKCSGSPYDSSVFVADQGTTMIIDLTTAGSSFTAIGGIFGDTDSVSNIGNFKIYGSTGILDTRTIAVGDMGENAPHTFYGWTTSGGDDIKKIEFFLSADSYFASVDDFQFGIASAVPIPASVWLFGSGLLGLIGIAKRQKAVL